MQLTCLSGNPNKPCLLLRFRGVTILLDCGLDISTALHFVPIPTVQQQSGAGDGSRLSRLQPYAPKDAHELGIEGELLELPSTSTNSSSSPPPSSPRVFVDSAPEFAAPDLSIVDLSEVDVVLISNYTSLLALPLVTEHPRFRGSVFLTEPTLHFGRLLMEETIEFVERRRSSGSARGQKGGGASACAGIGVGAGWKSALASLPGPLSEVHNPQGWRAMYSRSQMDSSLSKVTLVGYSEKKDVFGLLEVSPHSSGYCLGSSNWIITSKFEKIAYVSGSSTLTTHPRPMDQAPLRNSDCLILTALTQTPQQNPDPMIGEFCKMVVDTTRQGGNVLVPCYPSGIAYDLFECLAGQMDLTGLTSVPLFFVSPSADASLAYSNVMAEWLSAAKQNRVYLPEEPFPHGHLARCGRLKSFRNLHNDAFSAEYRQPCVMFCGHPSLRFGDVIHFLELWGSNSNNTIIFTEPSFDYSAALAPFQPLQMRVSHCPIDTALNFVQARKLVRDLKPGCLVLPECYTRPPPSAPGRTDLTIEADVPKYPYSRYETVEVPLKCRFESILLDPRLAARLAPREVRPGSGVAVATVTGNLVVRNNRYELRELEDRPVKIPQSRKRDSRGGGGSTSSSSSSEAAAAASSLVPLKLRCPAEYLQGRPDVRELVRRLSGPELGVSDARVEESREGTISIHLDSLDTLIKIESNQTHVLCHDVSDREREATRRRIRDVVTHCLDKF